MVRLRNLGKRHRTARYRHEKLLKVRKSSLRRKSCARGTLPVKIDRQAAGLPPLVPQGYLASGASMQRSCMC
jgi:hypothetical protein